MHGADEVQEGVVGEGLLLGQQTVEAQGAGLWLQVLRGRARAVGERCGKKREGREQGKGGNEGAKEAEVRESRG